MAELGLWDWDINAGQLNWSPKCLAMYGLPPNSPINYERFLQTIHPEDRERIIYALQDAVTKRANYEELKRVIWPDGSVHWLLSRGQVSCDAQGNPVQMTGVSFDISILKEAEVARQVHVWFLESLDKVNRAMQGTSDLQQMMTHVLDALLTIFNCDRAWLVYPCDPEAATWQSMMERTRPEYPGVLPIGVKLPLDPVGAAVYQILLEAGKPVQFGPGSNHAVPQVMAELFQVQSFMANAIYPKVGQAWSFGLHQCTHPRVWTPEEERLLQEIGWRLADSLTSLLTYRNLRQSEQRLEEAEGIAHVGWWDRDYEENRIALSDEACRIFGISLEVRDFVLADWHELWQQLIHPDDRAAAAEAAAVALQGGPRYEVEYRVIQPGGELRVIQSRGDVTWDDEGRPLRMFGIMQDITELRQVEAELRHNREAALQFSQQLSVLHEVTNQLSLADSSDELCRLAVQLAKAKLGFDRVSVWFIDWAENVFRGSFGTDEQGQLRDERTAVIAIKPTGLSWRVLSHQAPKAFVEYLPLYDHQGVPVGAGQNAIAGLWDGDKVIGVISVDNLITQKPITENWLEVLKLYATSLGYLVTRKRAQEAQAQLLTQVQDQSQKVHNIMDTVPEGVVLMSKNQVVTLTNLVAKQYLAHLAPNWEHSPLTALGSKQLHEILTSPPKGLWHEVSSHNLIFEVIARPIENSPHNGGWVLVLRDVTQERDIQNRVQRQDRLAAVGQMAAGIAHDFNNILTVIKLYAQLIVRTVELPRHAEDRLSTIEQQTERATDLIQQILDFSRQSILERQSFDLLLFLKRLVKLLDRTLPENISIELDHAERAFHIMADPSRIQQIVMNLAVNARDAMPDGGRLHISLRQVQTTTVTSLSLNDLPVGDWVVMEMSDSGTGIHPDVLAHIFEPFFTTKKVGEGTGLGLAQVYGIMQQHEGCVDVVSQIDEGTTFFLYFPALDRDAHAAGAPDQSLLTMGQGQTLLLVEDNQVAREALLGSLTLLNYEVIAAGNGRLALEILAENEASIDMVVSDVVMPEMGGIALFHAVREQYTHIPVVLLTGHAMNKDMENLKQLGLAGWMLKPPDLVALSHLLADVLPR
ncbi:MAG: PAS domain-containing protein [Chloroflexota bacterium]